MTTPTAVGRAIAIGLGCLLGGYGSMYMLSDYQLIQRLDDPNETDESGNKIQRSFKVSFRPVEPLKLRPEAEEKFRQRREKILSEKEALATETKPDES